MANSTQKQILEEGQRNAIVKLVGILDTSDVSWIPAISLSDFVNNDVGTLVGLRVDSIEYSSGPGLVTILEWQSNSPQLIASFAQSDDLKMRDAGGAIPDRTLGGYTGNINLRTKGFIAGNFETFTMHLKLVKLYTR